MKIIYLHQYFKFPNDKGGTRSYDLATSFVKKGEEVVVVSTSSHEIYNNGKRWNVIRRDGLVVHYTYLPYDNHFSYLKRSFVFFKFLLFSTFRLLTIKADVVLATSTPLTIGIPALIKKWIGKTKYIFEVRDVWPETVISMGAVKNKWMQKILYWLEKIIYKNASVIVPLSIDMYSSIASRFPQFSEKSNIVIENISEINRFQSEEKKVDLQRMIGFIPRFSLLYAGTFGKVNGIHKVIELASYTLNLDSSVIYILIGKGAEKERVIQLAKDKKVLGVNVFVFDQISKEELPMWYNSISMGSSFVADIKELWANSANKFFDTLAAAKPVMINHEGWQAEMIRTNDVGFVLSSDITIVEAERFIRYTMDKELYSRQCDNALELAIRRFSLEVATDKYFQVFDKI